MPLLIPGTLDENGLFVHPQGSDRNCQMATGDLVTILQDQRTIKVVSSPQSTCPAQYQATITPGIIEVLGGPRFPAFANALPRTNITPNSEVAR